MELRNLNPKAQELYKRFAEYKDKGWWKEVKTGQSGDSDIDTKQWKANSGTNAFYLSPSEYNRYNEIYEQEQEKKKKVAPETKKETTAAQATTTSSTSSTTPKTTRTAKTTSKPTAYTYKATTPVSFFGSVPSASPSSQSSAAPSSASSMSLSSQNPSGAATSLGAASLAPLMSQTANTDTRINNILAQLTGLLSGGGLYSRR